MKLSIGTKIGLGFSAALLALIVIAVVTSIDLKELTSDQHWVTHTVEVQQKLEVLRSSLPEAESSARGYQLTPNLPFKASFTDAKTHS